MSTVRRADSPARIACLVLVLASVLPSRAFAGPGWTWTYPLPQGNALNAIRWAAPLTYIAVGDAGTVLRSTDGGSTWRGQFGLVDSLRSLWGVAFATPAIGYAGGDK